MDITRMPDQDSDDKLILEELQEIKLKVTQGFAALTAHLTGLFISNSVSIDLLTV
jgi:hypothetical protein